MSEVQGITYTALLTGAPDSLPDLTLPGLASLQANLRDGSPSYFSTSLPGDAALAIISNIDARPNGEVVVTRHLNYRDGSQSSSDLLRFNLDAVRYDLGPNNRSVTLSGSKQTTNGSPQTREVVLVHQKTRGADGLRTWRASMANTITAGDTASYGGETFVVRQIDLRLSPREAYMEIRE